MTGQARVLNLLHAAHPDDVPRVLALFSDADLRAGLASEHCDPALRAVAVRTADPFPARRGRAAARIRVHRSGSAADPDHRGRPARAGHPHHPDREALCHAVLDPRPPALALVDEPGRAPEAVCLASRTPLQPALPDGVTPFGRPQADLRRLIHTRLNAALGDAPLVWHGVLARVGAWEGSFADLVALATTWGPRPPASELPIRFRARTEVFPPGVLFAMAPPEVAGAVLAQTGARSQDLVEGLLKHAPYHPAYLAHVLGPAGTAYHAACLAQNASMPLAAAHGFLDRAADSRIAGLLAQSHDDLALRLHAARVARSSADGRPSRIRPAELTGTAEEVHAMLAAAGTAEALADVLTELRPVLLRLPDGPGLRLLAYRRLAELAGPEAVWAVELHHAGRLDRMLPAVRASMTAESALPIQEAAAALTAPGPPPAGPRQDPLTEWPLEEAVRTHLDHRVDRWRVLIGLAGTDPAPLFDLVQRLGSSPGGQPVRPAGRRVQDLNRTPPADGPARGHPAREGDDR
ncbi:hypothetical protein [Catenulispora yoronensis]|uniref:hypothetical protein n=1 Tax=Catenulispora yoronensis TaxID=450799 RepID=UPI0031E29117